MLRAVGYFPDVPGIGAHEYLREFRNQRSSYCSATDDHREHPPKSGLGYTLGSLEIAQQYFTGNERDKDGNRRGDPNQMGQWSLEVEVLFTGEHGLAQGFVHKVGHQ